MIQKEPDMAGIFEALCQFGYALHAICDEIEKIEARIEKLEGCMTPKTTKPKSGKGSN
jgi:hypothetical protein